MQTIDDTDRRILAILQQDASLSLDEIGTRVALSRNAVWRRIRTMEEAGVIRARVALLDPAALGLALTVFITLRTSDHSPDWLDRFARATRDMPEILGVYRMTGDLDYLIRARVADVAAYDALYQRLIRRVPLSDVSASFVMEEIKDTTALPV
jgi:Lrp/AsnC family transcriptional regulator